MAIIADLHLHSKYSRAVSQNMDLFEIARWADKKGINLVSTADWTHPLWFREITSNLKEISQGVYILKNGKYKTKFILTTEVSSIYNQNNRQRRIHNLIFAPSIEIAQKINHKFQQLGINLLSDGRPIMGISSKDLLETLLFIDKNTFLIPCHVWTPWFSLYGSKSGFDSIEECFEDYSSYIYAIETGLSSDPIMNWQIKELENRSIVSFSDAHSGLKLGREATVFIENQKIKSNNEDLNFNYFDIIKALKQEQSSKLRIGYTIEFFPEEGKYHWSGHRNCNIRYSPKEIQQKGKICPICGKPLTIGVENRVLDLSYKSLKEENLIFAKNKSGLTFVFDKEKKHTPFVSLVPLIEILNEIYSSPSKAQNEYEKITGYISEFEFLMKTSYDEIEKIGGKKLRQALEIVRERKVFVDPGYDGVFGVVKIFKNTDEKNIPNQATQQTLF